MATIVRTAFQTQSVYKEHEQVLCIDAAELVPFLEDYTVCWFLLSKQIHKWRMTTGDCFYLQNHTDSQVQNTKLSA